MFAYDLARLTGRLAHSKPEMELRLLMHKGTLVPTQREHLVQAAQQWGASHILWLDSDMRFPADVLERLLAHNEPIVACNYSTRKWPYIPASAVRKGEGAERLFTEPDSEGLVEVQWCGMGVMLTALEVFEKCPEPWFQLLYSPKSREYNGEDVHFCILAQHHGFKVLVDQALSREIAHIGEMEFLHEHALDLRDVLMEQAQNGS